MIDLESVKKLPNYIECPNNSQYNGITLVPYYLENDSSNPATGGVFLPTQSLIQDIESILINDFVVFTRPSFENDTFICWGIQKEKRKGE